MPMIFWYNAQTRLSGTYASIQSFSYHASLSTTFKDSIASCILVSCNTLRLIFCLLDEIPKHTLALRLCHHEHVCLIAIVFAYFTKLSSSLLDAPIGGPFALSAGEPRMKYPAVANVVPSVMRASCGHVTLTLQLFVSVATIKS